MSISIGIIDEPVAPGAAVNLDISIHVEALVDFIKYTSTPVYGGHSGRVGERQNLSDQFHTSRLR